MGEKKQFHFTFTGRIVDIQPTVTFSSGFKKRSIVIDDKEDGAEYPNPVSFSLIKERCAEADKLSVGMTATVSGWFNGRKWHNENKGVDQYFCDLSISKIEAVGGEASDNQQGVAESGASEGSEEGVEPESEDLPF